MKRWILLLCCILLALSVTGCTGGNSSSDSSPESSSSQAQLQGWVSCRARFWSRAAKPVTRVYGSHCPRGQLQASPPGPGLVEGYWSWKPWQLLIP